MDECSGGGSSDTLQRVGHGKAERNNYYLRPIGARGKINDLTLSAGTSDPSRPRLLTSKGRRDGGASTLKSPHPLLNEILPAEIARLSRALARFHHRVFRAERNHAQSAVSSSLKYSVNEN